MLSRPVKRIAVSSLVLLGLLCLRYFFSISGEGGRGEFVTRIGQPDQWLVWQGDANGSDVSFEPFRWSVALGAMAMMVFYAAFRVYRWKPTAEDSPGDT